MVGVASPQGCRIDALGPGDTQTSSICLITEGIARDTSLRVTDLHSEQSEHREMFPKQFFKWHFFFARFWFWKKLRHFYRVRPQYLGFVPFLGYSRLKYGQIYEIALKTREGVNSTSFEWHFLNLQKKLAKKPTRFEKWFWQFGSFYM